MPRTPRRDSDDDHGTPLSGQRTPVALLGRLRRPGEKEAWDRFVDLYTPMLYSWARQVGLSAADAPDLVQDVFLTLVRKLPTFQYDSEKSFRTWLRTVTLNRWHENTRRRNLPVGGQGDLSELPGPNPIDLFEEEEYRRCLVRRALQLMQTDFKPNTWKACWEVVVVGRTAAEVADELGMTAAAVYMARSRVLERLREELTGLLD